MTTMFSIPNALLVFLMAGISLAEDLDGQLAAALKAAGFTGTAGSSLQARLGRPIDPKLANLGRLLFFDKIPSLHSDNACAGCHSPTNGFGIRSLLPSVSRTT